MNTVKTIVVFFTLFGVGVGMALLCQGLDASYAATGGDSPPTANRLVCLTPSVTEIVFALGRGDRVVGVSSWATYPPEAATKVKLGGYTNPNFERLIALRPDRVIFQGPFRKLDDFCRQHQIATIKVQMSDQHTNIANLYEQIRLVGKELGAAEEAEALCCDLESQFDEVRTAVEGRERPGVFFSAYRTPGSLAALSTINEQSFISELIDIAGGRNIFADHGQPYPRISKESLLKRRPEVIIEIHPDPTLSDAVRLQLREDWQGLAELPAVGTGRVYFTRDSALLIPGPRLGHAARLLAELIHPEAFHE